MKFAEEVSGDAADMNVGFGLHFDLLEVRIIGQQIKRLTDALKAFDGQFSVDADENDAAVDGFFEAVDDEPVAGAETGVFHRIAFDDGKESAAGMGVAEFGKRGVAVDAAIVGARQSGGDAR